MKNIDVRGYRFSYVDEGHGNAVVFVHGSALDLRYWNDVVGELSRSFRCIALSRRHHWPVPPNVVPSTYSAIEQTEDIVSFLESLQLGRVHLVGHSYGGYLCARIAAQRPDLLKSLTLVEPGGKIAGMETARSLAGFQQEALELIENGDNRDGVAAYLNSVCGEGEWQKSPVELQQISLANVNSVQLQMQDKSRPPLTEDLLAQIECPTLVMVGTRSPSPFPETAKRCAEIIDDCKLEFIQDSSHLINVDKFDAFIGILKRFFSTRF